MSVLVAVVGLLVGPAAEAADVGYFGIIKVQEFVQTSAAQPVARLTNGFAFNAFVVATSNQVVTNATVKLSNATPLRTLLPLETNTEAYWRFEERFNTQSALESTYPSGSIFSPVRYTNTMHTVHDGIRAATLNYALLSLVGNPPTPQVNNFAAAQTVDHTAEFRLQFNASGNGLIDLVQLLVFDGASNLVFVSPAPFSPGALTGTSNLAVIPPYTLPPGTTLTGHLTFARPAGVETNAYPGAIGVPAVARDTEFQLVTRPAPVPVYLEILSSGGPPYRLRYTGENARTYHLQATENFIAWTDLLVTNLASATYEDLASVTLPQRFYRIQVGP